MGLRCLVVEDDRVLAAEIAQGLGALGHTTEHVDAIAAAVPAARAFAPDAILLDRLLPDGDSARAIGAWRAEGLDMPILMLTARSALHERIEGLDAGADDYIAKPFELPELEARLRALVRMRGRAGEALPAMLAVGPLVLDYRRREVRRDGQLIPLQPRELKLLEELMRHAGEIVPRSQLLREVWNLRFDPRTKLIETHVSRLRDKLNAGHDGDLIETVRRVGYRLRDE